MSSLKKNMLAIGSFVLMSSVLLLLTLRGEWGNPRSNEIIASVNDLGGAFESSLSRGRFAQIMALAEDGRADLTGGKELIPIPDLGVVNGKAYPLFAPGLAFYSVPAYILGASVDASQLAVFMFTALVSILAAVMIILLGLSIGVPRWAAWVSAFIYLFATTAFPYAVTLAQHNFTVLFMMVILLAGLHGPKIGFLYLFGWTAYGLAIFMDYPNTILLLPAMVYMSLQALTTVKRKGYATFSLQMALVYTSLFFMAVTGLHGFYNMEHFGSPQTMGPAVFTRVKSETELENVRFLTEGNIPQAEDVSTSLFDAKTLPRGLFVLLLSEGRGLVYFAPVVLFGLIGLFQLSTTRQSRLSGTMAALVVVNLVLYGSFGDPWGGWEFGPRYLIITFSLLSVLLGYSLRTLAYGWYRLLVLVVAIYSVLVNLAGVVTTNRLPAEVEAKVLDLPYTYMYNFKLIETGANASFMYRSYVSSILSSQEYFLMLAVGIISILFLMLLGFPIWTEKKWRRI